MSDRRTAVDRDIDPSRRSAMTRPTIAIVLLTGLACTGLPGDPPRSGDRSELPYLPDMAVAMDLVGCPVSARTPDGCATCPAGLDYRDPGTPTDVAPPVTLMAGPFQPDVSVDQALVLILGCSTSATGPNQHFVLLERPDTTWQVAARHGLGSSSTVTSCVTPRAAGGWNRILCVEERVRPDCLETALTWPDVAPTRIEGWPPAGLGEACHNVPVAVTGIEDIDGDGDEDVKITVGAQAHVLLQDPDGYILPP